MKPRKLSQEFRKRLRAVTAKRAKVVIDHILKHGFITTEQLKTEYGYDHPPRAAQDVRDQGIPLERFSVKSEGGRNIAAYRFGDESAVRSGFSGGRQAFPKTLKSALLIVCGSRCQICLQELQGRYLQIDHRVPYAVAGDEAFDPADTKPYMLLDASCNRAKSWSCEHCENWQNKKSVEVCKTCYWASPESYQHIAMQDVRRLDVVWMGQEVKDYDAIHSAAARESEPMPEFVKRALRKVVDIRER